MISYNNCPVCRRVPSFTFKKRIHIDNYVGIHKKVAESYFQLANEKNPEEILSWCLNCRLIYRARFFDKEEINIIYSKLYYDLEKRITFEPEFAYNNKDFLDQSSSRAFKMVIDIERKFNIKIKDIFDIGGRDGYKLKTLANSGYNCKVFDPIPCESCDEKIKKESVYASEVKEGEGDFIFLCNVLEHCIDPHRIIKDSYDHLRNGGFLYIELPSDIETVFDWILFRSWRRQNLNIDTTHYVFYSFRAVTFLLESLGFNCIERGFFPLPVFKGNVLGVIGRKCPVESKLSKWISFDFDLFGSGHFRRLPFRIIKKAVSLQRALF